ncbi:hypothetical protein H6F98_08000 [Microcoleus sp. FACHB-SPT15]|uniref:hypothetical protein n=1 Tax=Microcoleus sp. FACHB-SPT15 TaxID=2692830 RepID=UPI0017849724|nr:hypothetical protein [Microcoleus sp. FACHB-SPT15]MBD1805390.1 hypothetical protein [Microcoleus sp. FACHB-SPT15]
MDYEEVQKKGKKVMNDVLQTAQEKGKQVIDKVTHITQENASEITEEAIVMAVDQAIDVMQIAGQRVREREIPTENVSLQVSVKILGLVELKMWADVPKATEVEEVISNGTGNSKLSISQDEAR